MHYPITAESEGERILKIGQHFPKLWASIKFRVFLCSVICHRKWCRQIGYFN